jgi:glycosyltransferase involved in cell wall biosynthesis
VTPGVALASVVKQNQLGYVPDLDIAAITDALENYLSNPQQAKKMGDRARQLVSDKYSWNHIAQDLLEIYKLIIQQNL